MNTFEESVSQRIIDFVREWENDGCSVEGCEKPKKARSYCEMHYARARKSGELKTGGPHLKSSKLHKRFTEIAASDTDDCIVWEGPSTDGYGHLGFKSKTYRVHVLACEVANGPRPAPYLHAAHNCGNSTCCNPRHMSWKTAVENEKDKRQHGTALRGVRHHQAKLTEDDVLAIRSLRGKVTRNNIARQFGIGRATVDNVIDKATWKHL